jgi:hypothetical protein
MEHFCGFFCDSQLYLLIVQNVKHSQVWWYRPVIPAHRRLGKKYLEYETILGCTGDLVSKIK